MTEVSISNRYFNSTDFDIDLYVLEEETFFLFFTVKEKKLLECWNSKWAFQVIHQLNLDQARVEVICGAFKTAKESSPLQPLTQSLKTTLWAKEQDYFLKLENTDVLNPGIFLDQYANRVRLKNWTSKLALKEKSTLLNLFSYTGAFSICALKAGFKSSVSIDLSARYLKWEKENFQKNFDGKDLEHRLIQEDSEAFLLKEQRRRKSYTAIVIDPPTFSRNGKNIFKVQEKLPLLTEMAMELVCKQEPFFILVSCNDSTWQERDFQRFFSNLASKNGTRAIPGLSSASFPKNHPMKSVWLTNLDVSR